MAWTIGLLAIVACYLLWAWYQTFKLRVRLQQLAQSFPIDFRVFVSREDGWETYDSDYSGKDAIKLTPNPQITSDYYYYIKFTGPVKEDFAIKMLINRFTKEMARRGKI